MILFNIHRYRLIVIWSAHSWLSYYESQILFSNWKEYDHLKCSFRWREDTIWKFSHDNTLYLEDLLIQLKKMIELSLRLGVDELLLIIIKIFFFLFWIIFFLLRKRFDVKTYKYLMRRVISFTSWYFFYE